MRAIVAATAYALAAGAPATALACPSCFAGSSQRVLETYYLTAAVLTALPLALVATVVVWLYRRSRA
jgi:hypothetical protein